MLVDTKGLGQEHVGKRLRLQLSSGVLDEIELLEITACEPPQPCCGITYTVLSAIRADANKEPGGTYWTAFRDIQEFQVLGDLEETLSS